MASPLRRRANLLDRLVEPGRSSEKSRKSIKKFVNNLVVGLGSVKRLLIEHSLAKLRQQSSQRKYACLRQAAADDEVRLECVDKATQTDFEDNYLDDHLVMWPSCVVCERSFYTDEQLERHRRRMRHWGCSFCLAHFGSEELLEYHKDEHCHWSDSESEQLQWESVRDCMDDLEDDLDHDDHTMLL